MYDKNILLESGTGELEVVVFKIGESDYCINVLKVREIIDLGEVSSAITNKEEILGITNVRGSILAVIDLKYILLGQHADLKEKKRALICEFNNQQIIFTVDGVSEIKRIKWSDISSPADLLKSSYIIGSTIYEKNIYSLLDFEKILDSLESPNGRMSREKEKIVYTKERGSKKIYLVEDSLVIRNTLKDMLKVAGYEDIVIFENGKLALDHLIALKNQKNKSYSVDLIITDIEMPVMDGHALTKTIKNDEYLKSIPVIIHSSLITEDLHHKGVDVGADLQISKPNIKELIDAVDSLLFKK